MCKPDLELGKFSQISDGAHAESLRFGGPHHQRIGVVKAERDRHADVKFAQRIANFLER